MLQDSSIVVMVVDCPGFNPSVVSIARVIRVSRIDLGATLEEVVQLSVQLEFFVFSLEVVQSFIRELSLEALVNILVAIQKTLNNEWKVTLRVDVLKKNKQ